MNRSGTVLALVALACLAAPAAAHGDHGPALDDQLLEAGSALMVGGFDAPQEGALVVVANVDGPLGCDVPAAVDHVLAIGGGGGVAFASNRTHVAAFLDLPGNGTGFSGAALDTADAVRTLIMMQEQAVALHRLVAFVAETGPNGTEVSKRTGVFGLPYPLPSDVEHPEGTHIAVADLEAGGAAISYTRGPGEACLGDDPGHRGVLFERSAFGRALWPGRVVHTVVFFDADVVGWLPRPVDSTHWPAFNLYLARPGEDPAAVRDALDPRPGAWVWVPLAGVAGALAWVARPT